MKTTPKLRPVKAWAVVRASGRIGICTCHDGRVQALLIAESKNHAALMESAVTTRTTLVPVLITPLPAKRKSTKPRTPKTKK